MHHQPVHLLIVDDDDVDREAIVRSLARAKIANPVSTAVDGIEALEKLRVTNGVRTVPKPRLVILDWKMPRMNGAEFLEELRADPELADTSVFVLTTSDDEADVAAAYGKQVAGYILKNQAGSDFIDVIALLDAYWKLVELPV